MKNTRTLAGTLLERFPFPKWVPAGVVAQAKSMSEQEALAALGTWALRSNKRFELHRSTIQRS
jgi:hypothetical protein